MLRFYRALILIHPFGTYIVESIKSTIIKSVNLHNISHKPLLLVEDKKALGIIYLSEPWPINLQEFKKSYQEHRITEAERIEWWKGKKTLYCYRITKRRLYDIPVNINYHPGPQIIIKPENIWEVVDKNIYVGTSGYTVQMNEYFKNLNSVEINYTYYQVPANKVWNDWFNESPKNFRFAIKLNRHLIYYQNTRVYETLYRKFMQGTDLLQYKLKALLIQYNKRYKFNNNNLEQLIDLIDRIKQWNNRLDIGIEFRDKSWLCNVVVGVMKKKKCAIVITNVNNTGTWTNLDQGFNPPLDRFTETANFVYIRMHGSSGQYTGGYDRKQLLQVNNFIEPLKVKRAYVYFNNTDTGHAYHDAQKLDKMMID
jgi:uncharacterized protein YecE (DUF72 family)